MQLKPDDRWNVVFWSTERDRSDPSVVTNPATCDGGTIG
jgi:hypothetical protein